MAIQAFYLIQTFINLVSGFIGRIHAIYRYRQAIPAHFPYNRRDMVYVIEVSDKK